MTIPLQLRIDPVTNDLEINAKGQWDLGQYVDQLVQCRLRMISEEWFLDEEAGMRWFQDVLRRGVSSPVIREDFRAIILGTHGIDSLESLTLDFDRAARRLRVTFRANGEPLERAIVLTD